MDLMGESCHGRPIRQNSAEILLRANLIQPHSLSPPFPFIFRVSKHPRLSCIHPILTAIFWLPTLSFIHSLADLVLVLHLGNPIKIWNFFGGVSHPMNSLAPSKALLSGGPLAILGNLNGLL